MFDFVMKMEGIEFPEALRILAKKAGVEVKKRDPEKASKREKLYDICELATKFFQAQLRKSKKGKKAKEYLNERGISYDSIKKWRLGYAPDSWQALSEFLISKGHERDNIVEAGLAIKKKEKNHSYDRFRGRIMFPITNPSGRVIAFGGRIFGKSEDTAKYLNSPQTPLYDKSKTLYGIDKAKMEMRREDKCVLVEGYTDVIMAHQTETQMAVSTSGTAVTKKQLNLISRYTRNIITAFDMDDAGAKATRKGIETARRLGFDVEVLSLPEGKDPADIIKKNSAEWKDILEKSIDVMDFYFQMAFRGRDKNNPKDKRKIAKELLPLIKRIPNEIEKSHWIKEFSERLDVDEKAVIRQLKKTKSKKKSRGKKKNKSKKDKDKKSRKQILEEKVLSLVAKKPERLKLLDDLSLFSKEKRQLLEMIAEEKDTDEKLRKKIDYFSLKPEKNLKDPNEEIKKCFQQLKKIKVKDELQSIHEKIKKAERENDQKSLEKLTKKAYKLSKQLRNK